jgi:allantoicase
VIHRADSRGSAGAPGVITSVDVDTSFFTGDYPESCSAEACGCEGYPGPAELTDPATPWVTIVPRSPLRGDQHNVFEASDPRRFTHVRLRIFPDGGVARLRVAGRVVPDPRGLEAVTVDLAGQQYGGAVVASSDDFYTAAPVLNRPGRARSMGEGWETRRRRDAGHDHVVFGWLSPVWSAGSWSTPRISGKCIGRGGPLRLCAGRRSAQRLHGLATSARPHSRVA